MVFPHVLLRLFVLCGGFWPSLTYRPDSYISRAWSFLLLPGLGCVVLGRLLSCFCCCGSLFPCDLFVSSPGCVGCSVTSFPRYFVLLGTLLCQLGRFVLLCANFGQGSGLRYALLYLRFLRFLSFRPRHFTVMVRSPSRAAAPASMVVLLSCPRSGWLFSHFSFFLSPPYECAFLIASCRVRVRLVKKRLCELDGFNI